MKTATLVLLLALAGCTIIHQEEYNPRTHTWSTGRAVYGRDPVSGKAVDVSAAIVRHYLGEPYYFESENNARLFEEHPSRFMYEGDRPDVTPPAPR